MRLLFGRSFVVLAQLVVLATVTAPGGSRHASAAPRSRPTASARGPVTASRALQIVSRRPEVRAYSRRLRARGKTAHVALDSEDRKAFSIHVFEEVQQGASSHTATFGWYEVDRKTGRVRRTTP